MKKTPNLQFESHAHFRVDDDFMPMVHLAARRRGLTAASFMRMAILDAVHEVNAKFSSEEAA